MANILIGVTGGIAAYKTVLLARLFIKNNHNVRVIMTDEAIRFITPLTFEALTHNKVLTSKSEVGHISHVEIAEWADICIVAPCTANTLAKIAYGIADNPLTTTILALTSPLLLAPSMNTKMYENIITRENINKLKKRDIYFIEAVEGLLACGDEGIGKLPEPQEIFAHAIDILEANNEPKILEGLKILVTGGRTTELLDPVRYISNRSSGKMGLAVANVAKSLGADVKFIAGNMDSAFKFDDMIKVSSADDMYNAIKSIIADYDILIMAAAVADYKAVKIEEKKIKKQSDELEIKLTKNIDILSVLSADKKPDQLFIGFAAESDNLDQNAKEKLERKKLDMIVANDISRNDIGFDTDMNDVKIFFPNGRVSMSGKKSKTDIAKIILTEAAILLNDKR